MEIDTTPELVSNVYQKLKENIGKFRNVVDRPLTLTEKILSGHFNEISEKNPSGGKDYVFLKPDRVALQDVTGQMVMLQFMQAELNETALPTTVHCDHLIRAEVQGDVDMKVSLDENSEVFKFLQSACAKYRCGFWKPGAGIIHQVVLENYAFPGGLMIGTDSHTPNAGGLGMIAIGVGGLDAAETMAGMPWELLYPKRVGVKLTGKLTGWTAPKDIILKVAEELTVSGGTNAIVEYFGPGTSSISCTGKATITNMGAEIGATCSVFPYDERMETYLKYTNRKEIAELANQNKELLVADPEVESEPEKYFDKIIEINLSTLEPHIVGPHTPDLARTISELADDVTSNDYVDPISVALIGSCTNSSYEDMSRAASLAEQAKSKGIKSKIPLLVTPGSEQIRGTIERDGQMDSLKEIGATVLANACGPCIGQWNRPELEKNEKNSIVTTFNRNFPGRNDGQRSTLNFIGSPEMIIALALGGKLSFNPLKDDLVAADGTKFKLQPPTIAPEVPEEGFKIPDGIFVAPPSNSTSVNVVIDPNSKRLQRLAPFEKWNGDDFVELPIMVKAKGKCTTDHISPAGAWLSLRGHLDNLSDNMLLGAVNAFNDEVGNGKNILNNEIEPFSKIARQYKQQGLNWIIIGDNNYGEGSSREHAAMTPRYLGCVAVITKSLARIHETNLKKQGVLALTFNDPNDYEKILEDDKISLINLDNLEPQKQVTCVITHSDGNKEEIVLNHSYNESQIQWFKHGSALNVLRNKK
ncbi:MAG: aconitate hydratase [Nitrosopumilus sp.]|uniref:Putative aconitate hydratase (ACO, acnA) n=2 Tax=environmental samples TaxID=651140 RepID=A0A075G897_9ARCH|nr:putative aconitate hydratase (ACO, acnA) [uncultured marine thaumarchaeote KM3_12_F11]AIF15517.1 putative aconitate hydratase (ACO, acnA) [uncultured marine thaumarchaeote KM3_70_D10]RCL30432.1 MAG: aconitate hydratase [Nitrosopumilus sp.]|tara:strand:+ start:4927 stop:7194 length:2268 start_codon:yes stop_codon:yes gene_type:complete